MKPPVPLVWSNLKEMALRIGASYEALRKRVRKHKRRMPGGLWVARLDDWVVVCLGKLWLASSGERWATARHAYTVQEAAAILGKSEGAFRRMLERNLAYLRAIGIRARRLPSRQWRVEFGGFWTAAGAEGVRG